jgi:SAM-dependent methyltransferase
MVFRDSREETENSHWWFVGRRQIVAALTAGFPAGPRLEVGCGYRGMLAANLGQGIRVGIDLEIEKLAALGKHGASGVAGTAEQLPFADNSFTSAMLLDVLEHVRDDWLTLAETHRVLQPAGRVLVTVPAFPSLWSPHDDAEMHLRRYGKRGLLQLCEGAGFRVVRSGYFNVLLFIPAAAWRLISRWLFRNRTPRNDFYMLPRPINSFLATIFSFERSLVSKTTAPFGLSLFAILEKQ